jgi:protein TonB
VVHVQSEMMNNQLTAPRTIPHNIQMVSEKEAPPTNFGVAGGMGGGDNSGVMGSMFGSGNGPQVKAAPPKKVNISAGVELGLLIQKVTPTYPPIAKAARVQGTVVLQATISKQGTIEDLRVISGPAMLQQAALDAVRQWRYRPYLLNNEPVEVETSVQVIFTLGG